MSHTIFQDLSYQLDGRKRKKKEIENRRVYMKEFCYDFVKISFILKVWCTIWCCYLCVNSCKGESVFKKNSLLVLFKKQQEIVDYRV